MTPTHTHPAGFTGRRRQAASPENIRQQICTLIRDYVNTRSLDTAAAVVHWIDQLCTHPAFDGQPEERCSYLRLRKHWSWLARAPAVGLSRHERGRTGRHAGPADAWTGGNAKSVLST